jgi:hypothetical protein
LEATVWRKEIFFKQFFWLYNFCVMKKNLLCRLLAIMIFATASLVLKSETCHTSKLNSSAKKTIQSETANEQNKFLFPSEEGFLIKI